MEASIFLFKTRVGASCNIVGKFVGEKVAFQYPCGRELQLKGIIFGALGSLVSIPVWARVATFLVK